MKYEIRLYVHGTPNGQKTWGVGDLDGNYIETFYGRKSNVFTQMFVEVRQFGSSAYCYYTYLRTGNVCDTIGRTGGYFALTLRINYYYADTQNIYNLLDAAYNKFIVGPKSIVSVNDGVTKYLITDFSQADATLKVLEQELNKYLMQFSSDSDFVPLSGFSANGQNEPAVVNILDCDVRAIANYIKSSSSISVSPWYSSVREQQTNQRMTAEINAVKIQAQHDVSVAQRDKEAGIKAIRNEYKEADRTISSLRIELDKANKEIIRLSGVVNDLNIKLQRAVAYEEKYDKLVKKFNKKNEALTRVTDYLFGLNEISKDLGLDLSSKSYGTGNDNGKNSQKKENDSSFMRLVQKIHPFMDFFVIIVLLGIIGFTLPKSCNTKNMSRVEYVISEDQGDLEGGEQDANKTVADGGIITDDDVQESQLSLKERFPTAKIDVIEINAQKPMKYGDGSSYTLSLQNVNEELDGEWESSDFEINENQVTPKRAGQCTISYVVGDDTLVTRTITVR